MNSQIQRRIIGSLVILIGIALFIPIFIHSAPSAVSSKTPSSPIDMVSMNIKLPPVKQSLSSTTAANTSPPLPKPSSQAVTPIVPAEPTLALALSQRQTETRQRLTDAQVKVLAMQHTLPAVSAKNKPSLVASEKSAYKKKQGVKKLQGSSSNKALSLVAIAKPQAWVLQVASFSHRDSAKKLARTLRQQGFDSYFKTQKFSSSKSLTRVFVGPELKKLKVQALQKIIKKQFGLNSFVRKYTIS